MVDDSVKQIVFHGGVAGKMLHIFIRYSITDAAFCRWNSGQYPCRMYLFARFVWASSSIDHMRWLMRTV